MTTILYSHPDCLSHDTGNGHPESAERLRALLARLDDAEFAALDRREAPAAQRSQISRVHAARYIAKVFEAVKSNEPANIAPDTIVARSSTSAFMRAAGAICAAVDAVIAGEARNAFCAVRPPGHHAAPGNTMGFCVFNNAAIGAEQARKAHGLERVAVVDFDVHHGNGTQTIYRTDPGVMVASIHQAMIFPMSGAKHETGVGNIVNVPILRNAPAAQFRDAFETGILPPLRAFRPEMIFLSAGFDAHLSDPLGDQKLAPGDFAWLTEQLMAVADECCGGRLVSILEGGYNPAAVAQSGAAHVRALMHH
jgi:acetoin utilization deacetylase AcuC-like enzyme